MSSSIVLKPTQLVNARAEERNVREFQSYLRSKNLHTNFELPRPIAILALNETDENTASKRRDDDVVYAMERAIGDRLSEVIYNATRLGLAHEVERELGRAAEFLAAYHAWGETRRTAPRFQRTGSAEVERILSQQGVPCNEIRVLAQAAELCCQRPIRCTIKKDAHAENWIVLGRRLMMLDLESTANVPVLFELAQLIEDCGALPATIQGWHTRMKLADRYLSALAKLGCSVPISQEDVELLYSLFWLLRCLFGFAYARRQSNATSSSSVIGRLAFRYSHWQQSAVYLARSSAHSSIRDFAAKLSTFGERWRPGRFAKYG